MNWLWTWLTSYFHEGTSVSCSVCKIKVDGICVQTRQRSRHRASKCSHHTCTLSSLQASIFKLSQLQPLCWNSKSEALFLPVCGDSLTVRFTTRTNLKDFITHVSHFQFSFHSTSGSGSNRHSTHSTFSYSSGTEPEFEVRPCGRR